MPEHVTVSSIRTLNTCKRKYYWRYIRNIDNNYLYLPFYAGGIVHGGIERFYKGKSPDEVINAALEDIKIKTSLAIVRPADLP